MEGTPPLSYLDGGGGGKCHSLDSEEVEEAEAISLTAYNHLLAAESSFKYLGRVLLAPDNYWTAVIHNLRIAQKKWVHLPRVLGWNRAD